MKNFIFNILGTIALLGLGTAVSGGIWFGPIQEGLGNIEQYQYAYNDQPEYEWGWLMFGFGALTMLWGVLLIAILAIWEN